MPRPIVYAYAEKSQVADSVAEYIIRRQNEALTQKETFDVAVSGGSLVKVLRNGLLKRVDVKWSKWRIFFSDERIVPLDHEDSNYGLLKRELLNHLNPRIHGAPETFTLDDSIEFEEADSDDFASNYQELVVSTLGEKPEFDLILLGCGPDGHTCSLFPGHKLLNEDVRLVAGIDDSPKPPPRRITITKPVLAAAESIAFVAEGAGKAPVLKRIFEHPEEGLPSSQVNEIAKNPVAWFVNNPAVEGVEITRSVL